MQYISTRGYGPVSFKDVLLDGLAPDGGLYLPVDYPLFDFEKIESFKTKSYQQVAFEVMYPYVEGELSAEKLEALIATAYADFDSDEITPLKRISDKEAVLELFHGPTLAFKDVALQLLGLLYDAFLEGSNKKYAVLGATSGDTGPAAIEGLKASEHMHIYMTYPEDGVSEIQRRQMTTVASKNVTPIAVKGSFDDCQHLVKEAFTDLAFKKEFRLTAVNSISWARLMPQIVYYFYTFARLTENERRNVTFVVPTGNFGDIFAGFVARYMGLEADFVLASNQNDILSRLVNDNDYSKHQVKPSQSPSIDIQVASNLERYLFELYARDGEKINKLMTDFKEQGQLKISQDLLDQVQIEIQAASVSEEETTETIKGFYAEHNYLLDPHSAVGVKAAQKLNIENAIYLATAHPAKFPLAVQKATDTWPELPAKQKHVLTADERFARISNDLDELKRLIAENQA